MMFLASLRDILGPEIMPPIKTHLFLKMIAYIPKQILVSIWIKCITEIQCDISKSFDLQKTVTVDTLGNGKVDEKMFRFKQELGSKEIFTKDLKTFL